MHHGFCMLLRKHITGSIIRNIQTSSGLERIIIIELECYNELNDLVRKKLIVELMGKHSNIILVNENNRIIDSLRHLDTYSKSYRDILPAREYILPKSEKLDFYETHNFNEFYLNITKNNSINLTDAVFMTYNGISNSFLQNSLKSLNLNNNLTHNNALAIYNYIKSILENISTSNISCKLFDDDYSIVLEQSLQNLQINFFIDDYYTKKENNNIFLEYRTNLSKLVLITLKKVTKKLNNINKKLKECENMEFYKLYGELIIANLYKLKNENNDIITLENYYDNNNLITIPLDKKYSISDNAKNYFKKYNKLKNALKIVTLQKKETEKELNYLESIIFELENSKTISDIDEIYSEISESDLFENIKKKKNRTISNKYSNKKYVEAIHPLSFKISDFYIYVREK